MLTQLIFTTVRYHFVVVSEVDPVLENELRPYRHANQRQLLYPLFTVTLFVSGVLLVFLLDHMEPLYGAKIVVCMDASSTMKYSSF